MDAEEIQQYRDQYDAIVKQLENDKENKDLLVLKKELEELLALALAGGEPVAPIAAAEPTIVYGAGEFVLARWKDGKYYKSEILSQTGSSENPIYTIKYLDYDEIDTVGVRDLRPLEVAKEADSMQMPTNTQKLSSRQVKKQKEVKRLEESKNKWKSFAAKTRISKPPSSRKPNSSSVTTARRSKHVHEKLDDEDE
ncbi:hypothetical protein CANCADRAFT_57767 [Tortispora caseinolytica NRRL Y-17796]|uniref:Tudor domain-containing protein n=1 Tax=Tortispora caseinolytica NRRL Y-17796 TaxID=767744 RepID=A0A1E4TAD7_9ASCO|nr:hypothetical protein CANCADRAFT_57767 [Tortispora caseinolytica NRRL Y-17796]